MKGGQNESNPLEKLLSKRPALLELSLSAKTKTDISRSKGSLHSFLCILSLFLYDLPVLSVSYFTFTNL